MRLNRNQPGVVILKGTIRIRGRTLKLTQLELAALANSFVEGMRKRLKFSFRLLY